MKKLLCISVVLFSVATAFSQGGISKGYWLIDGMGHFNSITAKNSSGSISDLRINPRVGYFVRDQLAIGAQVNISSYKLPNVDATTSYEFTPFARYYLFSPQKDFNIFADLSYGIGSVGQQNKEGFHEWTAAVGAVKFLNIHTGLELKASYNSVGGDAYPTEYHSTGARIGLQSHTDCGEYKGRTRPRANINSGDWLADFALMLRESRYDGGNFMSNNSKVKFDFGYFFRDQLAGGLRFEWSSQKVSSQGNAYQSTSIDPFLRYYILPATKVTNLFGHISYGIGSEGVNNNKDGFNKFGVTGGLAHFLNEHTALEATLNYRHYGGDLYVNPENSIGFRVGLQVHLDGSNKK